MFYNIQCQYEKSEECIHKQLPINVYILIGPTQVKIY